MCERCDAPDTIVWEGKEVAYNDRPYGDGVYWTALGILVLIVGFVLLKAVGF